MLGNAVPSLVAEVLAREIRRQILGHRVPRREPKLMPPRRHDTPLAEKPAPLPSKYKHLIGEHEAHPGTGKGYARHGIIDSELGLFSLS
jgi:DNA (cytosine-5)-methyltransferase 1